MSDLVEHWLAAAQALVAQQPYLALALGAAMSALFMSLVYGRRKSESPVPGALPGAEKLHWLIYRGMLRLVWAAVVLAFVAGSVNAMQRVLAHVERSFRHSHGRVTEANLQAVRTIWGDEQAQRELNISLGYETEEVERIESEDPTVATVTRKTKKWNVLTANPFLSCRHDVKLVSNPRPKGSAVYPGYETDCRFTYRLRNNDDHAGKATLSFPLPSRSAMFSDLVVKLDDKDVLPRVRLEERKLVLEEWVEPGREFTYEVAFKSRGMSFWYFQVREEREIRDFILTLTMPNLLTKDLNSPEGCMTPTEQTPTADGYGTVRVYKLDHAIVGKGMGISLDRIRQPGEKESEIIGEMRKAWVLLFAAVLLTLVRTRVRYAALAAVLIGAAIATGYGLIAELYETPLGFWLSLAVVMLPLMGGLSWIVRRAVGGRAGGVFAAVMFGYAVVYPVVAGLDDTRQLLYLTIGFMAFLGMTGWLVFRGKGLKEDGADGESAAVAVA